MNSLQKLSEISGDTPESYVLSFEKTLGKLHAAREVEMLMKKLQYLGLHFDPFAGEITSECQQVMDQLGLSLHLQNPYLATNLILRLLDKTEEHLNKLKQ